MLDILLKEDLTNVAVVVTRYFGGVLLGTGGLVRAYSQAVKEGLNHCVILEKQIGIPVIISTDYQGIGKIQYMTAQQSIPVLDTCYEDKVTVTILLLPEDYASFEKKIMEATNGQAGWEAKDKIAFACHENQVILL